MVSPHVHMCLSVPALTISHVTAHTERQRERETETDRDRERDRQRDRG